MGWKSLRSSDDESNWIRPQGREVVAAFTLELIEGTLFYHFLPVAGTLEFLPTTREVLFPEDVVFDDADASPDEIGEKYHDRLVLVSSRPDTLALVRRGVGDRTEDFIDVRLRDLRLLEVVLSDVSPDDETGGAALFSTDIVLTYQSGSVRTR